MSEKFYHICFDEVKKMTAEERQVLLNRIELEFFKSKRCEKLIDRVLSKVFG